MSRFELYYFPSCPYCQYVLHALENLPIKVTLKNIMENFDFRNELMLGGGKTQVPCLRVLDDASEEWMYESRDIVEFLQNLDEVVTG